MKSLCFIWPGKTSTSFMASTIQHYSNRIAHYRKVVCHELRSVKYTHRSLQYGLEKEGQAILNYCQPNDLLILLAEQGSKLNSVDFSTQLAKWEGQASKRVVFVVGGAYGVSAEVSNRAYSKLSLSAMTFPHEMARAILLEQVYRALTIQAGHGYHKEGI